MAHNKYFVGIWIACFLSFVSVGMSIPAFPFMLQSTLAGDLPEDALMFGDIVSLSALFLMIFAPISGYLGDRFDHRILLVVKFAMGATGYWIYSFADNFTSLLIGHLFVSVLLLVPVSTFAIGAHLFGIQDRVRCFGYMNAARVGGFVIGIALEGGLYEGLLVKPYSLGLGLTIAAMLIVIGVGRPPKISRPNKAHGIVTDNQFSDIRMITKLPAGLLLFAILLVALTGEQLIESNWDFFTELRFDWTPTELSIFLLTVYALATIILAFILDPLTRAIGDSGALMAGFLLAAIGLFGLSLTNSIFGIYVFAFFWAAKALIVPIVQALASRRLSDGSQGKLQGALMGVTGAANILVNTLFIEIFYIFSKDCGLYCFPGAPYFIVGILFLLCMFMIYQRRENPIFSGKTGS